MRISSIGLIAAVALGLGGCATNGLGVGIGLILLIVPGLFLLTIWAVIVASLAGYISDMPWPIQAIFYTAAGIIWILPLKPLLRWMELGRWR